jgi:hypothetical protein
MIADLIQDMGLSHTGLWLPATVGFLCGCLTTLFIQTALRRAPGPLSVPPAQDDPAKKTGRQALATMGPSAEKRGTVRRSGNAIPIFIQDGNGGQKRGFVVDRSAGGIGLALDYSVPLGTTIRVRPVKAPDTAPWVDVQVKSCRAEGLEFELGCQFLTVPPFNVMLLFG